MEKAIKLFIVKIASWVSPITMRAYDVEDTTGLARLLFDIPTNVEITAIPKEEVKL